MALITVRFYTLLSLALGIDSFSLRAADVEEAIAYLEEKFGSRLREQFRLEGKIQDHCVFLLNGINLRNLKQSELREGDILHVFLPAAGG